MKFVGIRRVENAGQILKWKYIKSKFEVLCSFDYNCVCQKILTRIKSPLSKPFDSINICF